MHGSETGDRKELSLRHRNTEPVSRVPPSVLSLQSGLCRELCKKSPGFSEQKSIQESEQKSKQELKQESGQEEVTLWRIPIAFLKIKTVNISLVIRA